MRKLIVLFLFVFVFVSCADQKKKSDDSVSIEGEIEGIANGYAKLMSYDSEGLHTKDSVAIAEGKFSLKTEVDAPELYYVEINERTKVVPVFIEPGAIKITGNINDLANVEIMGSESHQDFVALSKEVEKYDNKLNEVYGAYKQFQQTDPEKADEIMQQFDSLNEAKQQAIKQWVESHTASVVAPFAVLRYMIYELDYQQLEEMVQKLDTALNNTRYVIELNKRLDVLSKVKIGEKAPGFTQNDTSGNPVSLDDHLGQVVLLDFWASWCTPCREENPNVVKLYEKYHSKGFEIIGISLDNSRDRWVKAIHDDKLSWIHVSDVKGWKNEVSQLYGVNSIPHTVLLDEKGVIIAKRLRGEDLEKKISELLD